MRAKPDRVPRPLNAALRRCERTACQQAHFHRLAVGGPYYICVGV